MTPQAPRAVLFDMDGLLIDSERLWLEVESEVMAWLGGTWTPRTRRSSSAGRCRSRSPTCWS
ncbi:hypothetical protein [Actinomadura sp. WMMB 499]|uniref:hypothetical protein n=1 Tax=Actinomadura sp. WMMB 499 TaxID=1219491 RepID=UPI0034A0CF83